MKCVKSDMELSFEPSLVTGPFSLGTMELLGLLIRGQAKGNIAAFCTDSNGELVPNDWPISDVGLLSFSEVETGIPVCDTLKRPRYPVFVLHGGGKLRCTHDCNNNFCFTVFSRADHFTIAYGDEAFSQEPSTFYINVWNGLPPNRGLQRVRVNASKGMAPMCKGKPSNTYYKPTAGEIEEVIQAHSGDREKTVSAVFCLWGKLECSLKFPCFLSRITLTNGDMR
jgi:hypothetical protein